jgi:hypothetical protein
MKTRRIRLDPQGQYAVTVDACDFAYLHRWKWTLLRKSWPYGTNIYARRDVRVDGRTRTIFMHRMILRRRMRLPSPRHQCDHRDIDSLNNTRRNLRWATRRQQFMNRRPRITGAQIVAYHVAEAGCASPLPGGERVAREARRVRGPRRSLSGAERPSPQPSPLRGEGAQAPCRKQRGRH